MPLGRAKRRGEREKRTRSKNLQKSALGSRLLDLAHADVTLSDGKVGGQARDDVVFRYVAACEGEDRVASYAGKDDVLEGWGDKFSCCRMVGNVREATSDG